MVIYIVEINSVHIQDIHSHEWTPSNHGMNYTENEKRNHCCVFYSHLNCITRFFMCLKSSCTYTMSFRLV